MWTYGTPMRTHTHAVNTSDNLVQPILADYTEAAGRHTVADSKGRRIFSVYHLSCIKGIYSMCILWYNWWQGWYIVFHPPPPFQTLRICHWWHKYQNDLIIAVRFWFTVNRLFLWHSTDLPVDYRSCDCCSCYSMPVCVRDVETCWWPRSAAVDVAPTPTDDVVLHVRHAACVSAPST